MDRDSGEVGRHSETERKLVNIINYPAASSGVLPKKGLADGPHAAYDRCSLVV
jgi:hypothetical protein